MAKISEDGLGIVYSDFDILYAVDCAPYLEKKKSGSVELTYLSWSDAWAEVMKRYPDSNYSVRMFDGKPYFYDESLGYMVFVNVQIGNTIREMWLPVQDGANKAMKSTPYEYKVKNREYKYAKPDGHGNMVDKDGQIVTEFTIKRVEAADMSDINKALMRCLVKGIAMFGLGLYIYSGEDVIEWSFEEHNKIATEFMKVRSELSRYVDIRTKTFEDYCCEKTGVHSVKPEVIVNLPGEMRRVTALFSQLLEKKKEEAEKEKKEAKDVKKKKDEG